MSSGAKTKESLVAGRWPQRAKGDDGVVGSRARSVEANYLETCRQNS